MLQNTRQGRAKHFVAGGEVLSGTYARVWRHSVLSWIVVVGDALSDVMDLPFFRDFSMGSV